MLSKADNELLTRSGKGTAMGDLLRRFWMPALLAEELPERDGPPRKIRVMGENLLAFRDSTGRIGIVEPRRSDLQRHSAHGKIFARPHQPRKADRMIFCSCCAANRVTRLS